MLRGCKAKEAPVLQARPTTPAKPGAIASSVFSVMGIRWTEMAYVAEVSLRRSRIPRMNTQTVIIMEKMGKRTLVNNVVAPVNVWMIPITSKPSAAKTAIQIDNSNWSSILGEFPKSLRLSEFLGSGSSGRIFSAYPAYKSSRSNASSMPHTCSDTMIPAV